MLIKKTVLCGLILSTIVTSGIANATSSTGNGSQERFFNGLLSGSLGGMTRPPIMPDGDTDPLKSQLAFWNIPTIITAKLETSFDDDDMSLQVSYRYVDDNKKQWADKIVDENFNKYTQAEIEVPKLSTFFNVTVFDDDLGRVVFNKNYCFYNNLFVSTNTSADEKHTLVNIVVKQEGNKYVANVGGSMSGYIQETLSSNEECWTEKPELPNPNHG